MSRVLHVPLYTVYYSEICMVCLILGDYERQTYTGKTSTLGMSRFLYYGYV